MNSVTVVGTVPWRDPLNAPPERTVVPLRAKHGIVIFVELEAWIRSRPGPRSTPLRLGPITPATHGSGPVIPGLSTQGGTFVVGGEYTVGVDVIYGGSRPTGEQRGLMRAELARLVLPRWPRVGY